MTSSATPAARGSSSVNGPGQQASASARAAGGTTAAHGASSASTDGPAGRCTMTGWVVGRPFTA